MIEIEQRPADVPERSATTVIEDRPPDAALRAVGQDRRVVLEVDRSGIGKNDGPVVLLGGGERRQHHEQQRVQDDQAGDGQDRRRSAPRARAAPYVVLIVPISSLGSEEAQVHRRSASSARPAAACSRPPPAPSSGSRRRRCTSSRPSCGWSCSARRRSAPAALPRSGGCRTSEVMNTNSVTGASCGIVMCRNSRQRSAPSTWAASYSDGSIDWRPARKKITTAADAAPEAEHDHPERHPELAARPDDRLDAEQSQEAVERAELGRVEEDGQGLRQHRARDHDRQVPDRAEDRRGPRSCSLSSSAIPKPGAQLQHQHHDGRR